MLLIVLAAAFVLGTAVMALFNYLPQSLRERSTSRDYLDYNTLLGSSVEYMQYAIRERWFIDPVSGAQDKSTPLGITLTDWADHPHNLERMILTDIAINHPQHGFNARLGRPVNDRRILLGANGQTWRLLINKERMTKENPLHLLIDILKNDDKVKGIEFTVTRMENVHYPSGGRGGVFLKIRASLAKYNPLDIILHKSSELYAEAVVGYFPRELTTHALFVPNALRMDVMSHLTPLPAGDVAIPVATNANAKGITFLSPVYVNGDVVIPEEPEGGAKRFNPTTFADTLYLGDGALVEPKGSQFVVFEPKQAGGLEDALYESLGGRVGGFRRGITRDGYRDSGLDYLFGVVPTTFSNTVMQTCAKRAQVLNDLSATASSALVATQRGSTSRTIASTAPSGLRIGEASHQYKLALTDSNFFAAQVIGGFETTMSWHNKNGITFSNNPQPAFAVGMENGEPLNRPILNLKVKLVDPAVGGDNNIIADMSTMSDLHATVQSPQPDPAALPAALESVKSLSAEYDAILARFNGKDPSLDAALESQLRTEMDAALGALAPGNSNGNGGGNGNGNGNGNLLTCDNNSPLCRAAQDATRAYRDLLRALELRTVLIPEAQASVQRAQYANDIAVNPFQIAVSTRPYKEGGVVQPDRVELVISTRNEETLRFLGKVPILQITAYEVGSSGAGTSVRTPATAMASNLIQIKFKWTADGLAIDAPADLVSRYYALNPAGEPAAIGTIPDGDTLAAYDVCDAGVKTDASFDFDFAPMSRSSWNFRPPPAPDYVFNDLNSTRMVAKISQAAAEEFQWPVYSIVRKCIIESTADFVTGFFTCDELVIQARTTPLRIIGTFAVGKATIDPSAINAGIVWSSIYHPDATIELRIARQLGRGKDCAIFDDAARAFNLPVWGAGAAALTELATLYACMPAALRGAYPEPFTWTTYKPVCGTTSATDSTTSCTFRDEKYSMMTLSFRNSLKL